jgi:clan AA aspartic protease (TIGR02281 family)
MHDSRLSPTRSADIVATVAEALHFAHTKGIVHRDIKPENILLDGSGVPYVADFGIALRDEDFAKESHRKLFGSPTYMSPEQATGKGHLVDGRSDVFSLGVVFYELLTGVNPFQTASLANALLLIATVEPKPPRQINDSVPKELESICLKALSKRPTDRFTTAKDFGEELRRFLRHDDSREAISVAQQDTPRVFGIGFRRLSHGQFGCALVVGALVLMLAALPQFFQRISPEPKPKLAALHEAGEKLELPPPEVAGPKTPIVDLQPNIRLSPQSEPPAPALPRQREDSLVAKERSEDIARLPPVTLSPPSQSVPVKTPTAPSVVRSVPVHSPTRDAETLAQTRLAERGVRISHSDLSLVDEKDLTKAFSKANDLKRKLVTAAKERQAAELQLEELQTNLRQLQQTSVELNSQLANTANDVAARNQLVGALNANHSEMKLLEQAQEQSKKDIDADRKKSDAARERYLQQVAEIRALADRLSERYTALKADVDAQSAVAEWNAAANTKLEIKPSAFFLNSVKKLEKLEQAVISEKIPLRREGNSYYAIVIINGKPPQEMILDTGASSVVLPYNVAIECGLKPDESTATVIATVADGSKVKSKLLQLDSVRVGKFSAEHVECVVLPPEVKNAPTLLGMTFLSRFNFSINGTELTLTKIEGTAANKNRNPSRSQKIRRSRPKDDQSR